MTKFNRLWISAVAGGLVVVSAFAQSATRTAFDDADELTTPSNGLYDTVSDQQLEQLPVWKKSFCARSEFDIAELAEYPLNLMGMDNKPGYLNMGLCWWHSRFQRSANYLANFRPELPKPTRAEAKKIISKLSQMDEVVEIPGYRNLLSFSLDHEKLITKMLSNWQLEDGARIEPMINGLSDSAKESAAVLQARMDQLYERMLRKKAIVWQKLQMPGKPAHSWLVLDIQPVFDRKSNHPYDLKGYDLKVVDSNLPFLSQTIKYRHGDQQLKNVTGRFVPHTDYDGDLEKIERALLNYCAK